MRRATRVLLGLLILLLAVPLLLHPALRPSAEDSAITLLGEGWVDDQGQAITLPGQTAARGELLLTRTLPEVLPDGACIALHTCGQTLHATVGGREIMAYEPSESPLALKSPDAAWHLIPLPTDCGGQTLTLRLTSAYSFFARILPAVALGDRGALQLYLLRRGLLPFCSALLALGGGVALLIWLVLRRLDHRPTFAIGWLDGVVIILSLVLLTQNAAFDILLGRHLITAALWVMLLLLCPLSACLLTANRLAGEKHGRVWQLLCLCDAALLALCYALHLLGVADLLDMVAVLCWVQTVLLLAAVVEGMRREHPPRWTLCVAVLFFWAAGEFCLKARFSAALHILCFGILVYACHRILVKERQMAREKQSYQQEAAVMSASNMLVQIKTHFFYHTMASIRTLIRLDPDAAYVMITDLSRYLRYRVDRLNAPDGLVLLEDELEAVEAYVHIKQVEMKERLRFQTLLNSRDFRVPVFSVQALVENAIRHGLQPKPSGGCVLIRTYETPTCWVVTVRDNGVGFDPALLSADGHPGALDNIRHRLATTGEGELALIGRPGVGSKAILRLYKSGQPKGGACHEDDPC